MPAVSKERRSPNIRLSEGETETTLYIDDCQAMQAWERDLMETSAALLCEHGSDFLEVGLGLGISALRIASAPRTRRHVVVERHQEIIEMFRARRPELPSTLSIIQADWFDYVETLAPESLDGIFFDPTLPTSVWDDPAVWAGVMPKVVRALRPGGAFVPFFSTEPELRVQFRPYFTRVLVLRRPFVTYRDTNYTSAKSGDAFIQCFVKEEAALPTPAR